MQLGSCDESLLIDGYQAFVRSARVRLCFISPLRGTGYSKPACAPQVAMGPAVVVSGDLYASYLIDLMLFIK